MIATTVIGTSFDFYVQNYKVKNRIQSSLMRGLLDSNLPDLSDNLLIRLIRLLLAAEGTFGGGNLRRPKLQISNQ
jgi:hypothetical protein